MDCSSHRGLGRLLKRGAEREYKGRTRICKEGEVNIELVVLVSEMNIMLHPVVRLLQSHWEWLLENSVSIGTLS